MYQIILYLLIFLFEFLLCHIAKKSKNKFLILMCFIFPVLYLGTRFNVGTDYKNYTRIFYIIKNTMFSELSNIKWEYGALIVFKITSLFFEDAKYVFIPIAALSVFPLYKINKIYDFEYLPLSFIIFNLIYMPFYMNGMRQGIAMSFALYSIVLAINDNKKIAILLTFLISILFHNSALLLLPYIIIIACDKSNDKSNSSKQILMISIALTVFILFFSKLFINNLDFYFYNSYINRIDASKLSLSYFIIYIPIILMMIFIKEKNDKVINVGKSIMISGYLFGLIGTSAKYLNRISIYFTVFEILFVPYVLKSIKIKKTRIIIICLYISYLIVFFVYQYYYLGRHQIFPYNTWLISNNSI